MPCSRTQHGLTRVGLEPRPLDPESEALTTRPPRSPVTIGNGMRLIAKLLTYLSGLSYLDTRNNQLIVIKTIQIYIDIILIFWRDVVR